MGQPPLREAPSVEGATLKPDWPDIEVLKYYLLNFKGEFGGQLNCMLD